MHYPTIVARARAARLRQLMDAGVPEDLARRLADLAALTAATDIVLVAARTGKAVSEVAVSTSSNGIVLSYPFKAKYGGASYLGVIGEPADSVTPQQIVNDEASQIAPNAQVQFLMPQAYVGYWPGYGEAFETQVASADGHSATYELVVIAAVHDGFGIAVVASGELLSQVTPGSTWWDGHPSPTAISVAYLADNTVNSITFPSASR